MYVPKKLKGRFWKMKSKLVLVIVFLVTLLMIGCSQGGSAALIGMWVEEVETTSGIEERERLEFENDGTVKISEISNERIRYITYTWEVEKGRLIMRDDDNEIMERNYKISGSKLVFTDNDGDILRAYNRRIIDHDLDGIWIGEEGDIYEYHSGYFVYPWYPRPGYYSTSQGKIVHKEIFNSGGDPMTYGYSVNGDTLTLTFGNGDKAIFKKDKTELFIGTWVPEKDQRISTDFIENSMTLSKDGTGRGDGWTFAWKAENDRLTLEDMVRKYEYDYKISGSMLTLTSEGKSIKYKKE
jgi:hypothetical protein